MKYDNSSLQQFKDCPERYRLRFIERLHKREEGIESHDKNFGKAIHAGLEAHYTGKSYKEAFEKDYGIQLDIEDKAKTLENGLLGLQEYVKFYEREDKEFEVLEVEQPDEIELVPGIKFIVKRDMVIKLQGCVYVMEHKTTKKSLGWDYWGQFEPNSQITAQTYSCQLKYGECSGVIVNVLQFGHRERAYKGEPAGAYHKFQRQVFNRTKEQCEAWRQDTIKWIDKINKCSEDRDIWNKNEGQCRYCSYKEVCNSLCDEQIVEQLYERIENPFSYLETEVKEDSI